jgi:PAS domain S-box-containing protein
VPNAKKERLSLAVLSLVVLLALFQTFQLNRAVDSLRQTIDLYELYGRLNHLIDLAALDSDPRGLNSELDALLKQHSHLTGSEVPPELAAIRFSETETLPKSVQYIHHELELFRGSRLPRSWSDARQDIWLTALLWLLALVVAVLRAPPQPLVPTPKESVSELPISVTHMALEARESSGSRSQTSVRSYTERVLKALSNLLVLAGPDGQIQMVNDAVCSVLGYERGELLGLPHQALLDSDLSELPPGTKNMETGFRKRSGESVPVLVSSSAVYGESSNELEGLVIVAQDISERKETERSLQASEKRLRHLMERLQNAQEEERQKVARDLHDGMLQLVIAAEMQLTVFRKKIDPKGEHPGLRQGIECLSEAVKEGRQLIQNLRPPSLDKFGLVQSVRQEGLKLSRELQCETEFNFELEEAEIPSSVENAVFRICQEALNNIRKHAHPKKVSILIKVTHGSLVVTVEDDGEGFDMESDSFERGVGLDSMSERAELQGGYLKHQSQSGQGTRVTAVIPLNDVETS